MSLEMNRLVSTILDDSGTVLMVVDGHHRTLANEIRRLKDALKAEIDCRNDLISKINEVVPLPAGVGILDRLQLMTHQISTLHTMLGKRERWEELHRDLLIVASHFVSAGCPQCDPSVGFECDNCFAGRISTDAANYIEVIRLSLPHAGRDAKGGER